MTNRFLISVAAAALIAGTGFANAQGMNRESGGAAGGSTMQQGGGAPSDKGGSSMNRESGPSGAGKGAQSDKMEGGKNAQSDKMEGGKAKSAQDNQPGKAGKDMKAEGREGKEGKSGTVGQAPADKSGTTTQGREDRMGQSKDKNAPTSAQGQDRDRMNADTKGGSQGTTGQAGAGAKLTTEQQTKISTVIKQQNVAPVTNVNFSISVGTRVPRDVHFHTLPAEVVTIYPQWRGYRFIRVREEIVIIDPNTFEIVEIIRV
jgi:hypothetical protein